MYRVNERARRERTTSTLLDLRVLFATVIVSVLAVVGTTAGASAQVGNTDRFTPQSWQAGEGEARRSRSPRRAVTTTSNLEDFDVPATSVRRSAKSSSARASRIVERSRPTQRRVRVAALSRSDAQSVAAPARSAQRATPRRTRVASLGRIGLPSVSAPRPSLSGGGIAWRAFIARRPA